MLAQYPHQAFRYPLVWGAMVDGVPFGPLQPCQHRRVAPGLEGWGGLFCFVLDRSLGRTLARVEQTFAAWLNAYIPREAMKEVACR